MKQKSSLKRNISIFSLLVIIMVGLIVERPVAAAEEEKKADNCTEYESHYYDGEEYDVYRTKVTDEAGNVSYPNYPQKEGYIFAGWYQGREDGTDIDLEKSLGAVAADNAEGAWAKFVPDEVLSVKAQISSNMVSTATNADKSYAHIRFVTTVDTLKYNKVGFDFSINGGNVITKASNKVYTQLRAVGDTSGDVITYTPSGQFCALSSYFKTWTFTNVPSSAFDVQFAVTPFWITSDGTKVCGEQVIKTINQGLAYSELRPFEAEYDYEYFETLEEAIEAVNDEENGTDNAVIALLKDVTIEKTVVIGGEGTARCKNLTITNLEKDGTAEEYIIKKSDDFTGTNVFAIEPDYALTITGVDSSSQTGIIIDGNGVNTAASFVVNEGIFTVKNSTIKNSLVIDGSGGGAITNVGTLIIDNAKFIGNQALRTSSSYSAPAGAININDGIVSITNTLFKENTSTKDGGAIRNASSSEIKISDCTFDSNIAGTIGTKDNNSTVKTGENAQGGAIYMTGASSFSEDSLNNIFIDNEAPLGGAIGYNSSKKSIVIGWSFNSNCAYQYISSAAGKTVAYSNGNGGAVYVSKIGKIDFVDSLLTKNIAYNGGAVCIAYEGTNYGRVEATNTLFDSNQVLGNCGGAIYNQGILTTTNCDFINNIASDASGTINKNAGAIYVNVAGATATLKNTKFVNNQAKDGGAIRITNGTVIANGCTFDKNIAAYTSSSTNGRGGAIYLSGGAIVKLNETGDNPNVFQGNKSEKHHGGAIYCEAGTLSIGKNTFKENTSEQGGAIYHSGGSATIFGNGQFSDNIANTTGKDIVVAAGQQLNICDTIFENGEVSLVAKGNTDVGCANVSGILKGVTFRYYVPEDKTVTSATKGITVSASDISTTSDIKIIPYTYAEGIPVIFGSLTELSDTELARFGTTSIGDGKHFGVNDEGQLVYTPVAQIGTKTYFTLQEALGDASSGDTITLLRDSEYHKARTDLSKSVTIENTADRTVTLYKYEGTVTSNNLIKVNAGYKLTVRSIGDNNVIIDGRSAKEALADVTASTTSSALLYADGGNIELTNVIMRYANTTGSGGCIQIKNASKATLNGCVFESNKAGAGGVVNILSGGASAVIEDCEFTNNIATNVGGAVYLQEDNTAATITRCIFKNNVATSNAGALGGLGTLTCVDCDFVSNKAGNPGNANGGAIYAGGNGKIFIRVSENGSSTFDGNTAYRQSSEGVLNLQTYGAICANSNSSIEYSAKCIFVNNTDGDLTTSTDANTGFALGEGIGRASQTSTIVVTEDVTSYETLKTAIKNASTKRQTKIILLNDISIGDTRLDVDASGKNVLITNASNTAVKITRGNGTNSNLFAVGEESTLSFVANSESNGALTIDGSWDAQKSAMLYVKNGGTLILDGVTVLGGKAGDGAAVKVVKGTLKVEHCSIKNNTSANGGAISLNSTDGEVNCTIKDTVFEANNATTNGGALYMAGSNTLTCSLLGTVEFNENNATTNGGAIYITNGTLTTSVDDENGVVNFVSNYALYGGAIYQAKGNVSLLGGGKFELNKAGLPTENSGRAGAVDLITGIFDVSGYDFIRNTAVKDAGALRVDAGTANVKNCNFTNNSAGTPKENTGGDSIFNGRGGAIYISGGGKGVLNLLGTGHFSANKYTHTSTGTVSNAIYKAAGTMTGTELYTYDNDQTVEP